MKNILKIMLMMITIFTIAGSAVYAAEIPVSRSGSVNNEP